MKQVLISNTFTLAFFLDGSQWPTIVTVPGTETCTLALKTVCSEKPQEWKIGISPFLRNPNLSSFSFSVHPVALQVFNSLICW